MHLISATIVPIWLWTRRLRPASSLSSILQFVLLPDWEAQYFVICIYAFNFRVNINTGLDMQGCKVSKIRTDKKLVCSRVMSPVSLPLVVTDVTGVFLSILLSMAEIMAEIPNLLQLFGRQSNMYIFPQYIK